MKNDQSLVLKEILRRRDILIKRRERRILKLLSGSVCSLSLLLFAIGMQFSRQGEPQMAPSVYGSFLLSDEDGLLVLIGVVAFVLGVMITMLCLQYRKSRLNKLKDEIDKEAEERK